MLHTCSRCGTLTRGGSLCPHCGNSVASSSLTAAALVLGLTMAGCSGSKESGGQETMTATAMYGVSVTDVDGDGYPPVDAGGNDCDDNNKDIHPDATEKVGDGVDSNCDGSDDT